MAKFRHLSEQGVAKKYRYKLTIVWSNKNTDTIFCNAQEGRDWVSLCNADDTVTLTILDLVSGDLLTTL